MLEKFTRTKFRENAFIGIEFFPCIQRENQTWRRQ